MSRYIPKSDYEEELPWHRRVWRWWKGWKLAVAAAVLAAPLVFLAVRPIYRMHRQKQAAALMAQAEEAARRGDAESQGELIRRAATLGMGSPELMRSMAGQFVEMEDPRALVVLRALAESGEATDADRQKLVAQALVWKQPAMAADEVTKRLAEEATKKDVTWTSLCARWLGATDRLPEALALLTAAREAVGGGAAGTLDVEEARLLTERPAPDAASITRALTLLRGALAGEDAAARAAAAKLLATQLLPTTPLRASATPDDASRAATVLQATADAAKDHAEGDDPRLTAAALRVLADGSRRDAELQALRDFFTPLSDQRQLGFARWMVHFRFLDEALTWIGTDDARLAREAWLLTRLDALAGLDRWQDCEDLLRRLQGRSALSKSVAALFMVRSGLARKLDAAEMSVRRRALDAALDVAQPTEVFYVAWNLHESGQPALALPVYERLTKSPQLAVPAALGAVRCLAGDRAKTAELREALGRLVELQPESLDARNDLAYVRLLTGADTDDALKTARELVVVRPQFLAVRTTAALGELVAGRPVDALKFYDGVSLDWSTLPPHWAAVRAAALAASDKVADAMMLANGIDRSRLRAEEAALLDRFLRR